MRPMRRAPRRLAPVLVLVVAGTALGVAACGDDDPAPAAQRGDADAGRTVFEASCAGCHALPDDGTGSGIGPSLANLKPDYATVVRQVTEGGGGMPSFADDLTETQIRDVGAYVTSVLGT